MSRKEGTLDWEFDDAKAIGAVPKLIGEVRAAVVGVPVNPEDGSVSDVDKAAAFDCVKDALSAFDEAAKTERNAKDVAE